MSASIRAVCTPNARLFLGAACQGGTRDGQSCWNGDADCPSGTCNAANAWDVCPNAWLQMCGVEAGDEWADVNQSYTYWTAGYGRADRRVTVASGAGYCPGDTVILMSDPPTAGLRPKEVEHLDFQTYFASVAAVEGNVLVLDRGLPLAFTATGKAFGSASAAVSKQKMLRHSGVECLTLQDDTPPNPAHYGTVQAASLAYAEGSWMWRVDFGKAFHNHLVVHRSTGVAILSSSFGVHTKSTLAAQCDWNVDTAHNACIAMGTVTFDRTHDSTLADNDILGTYGALCSGGSTRNWIAYNYLPKPPVLPTEEIRRAFRLHGFYPSDCVYEGNVFWGDAQIDDTWGTNGRRNTFFRNVAYGGRDAAYGPGAGILTLSSPNLAVESLTGVDLNFLLNRTPGFGREADATQAFDFMMDGAFLERNAYTSFWRLGDPTAVGTVLANNYDATTTPLGTAWDSLLLPDSLNHAAQAAPPFWCKNTVGNGGPVCNYATAGHGVGALWDGTCKLPAQVRFEGGQCL